MPASQRDIHEAHRVVHDATLLLDWCAGKESSLEDEHGERSPVIRSELIDRYRKAVDQAKVEYFAIALDTLEGKNPDFPHEQVVEVLERAGWTGSLREFKVGVLKASGRDEVMDVAGKGRKGGGRVLRRMFRGFLGALNAALESLDGIPGVGAIKELKHFVEGAEAASE